jgi:hypothetical protein
MTAINTPLAISNWGVRHTQMPCYNCEPCEHQDQSKSNMGQGEDRCVGDALRHLSWLSKVVRHEHGLTVSWHQRVNRAEQDSGSHCEKDGPLVSAGKITEAGSHAPIQPVLQINERLHYGGPNSRRILDNPPPMAVSRRQ